MLEPALPSPYSSARKRCNESLLKNLLCKPCREWTGMTPFNAQHDFGEKLPANCVPPQPVTQ